jgi:hypothetical protein
MTPNPNITVNRPPPGLRRLVEALRLEGQRFDLDRLIVLRRPEDIIQLSDEQGGSKSGKPSGVDDVA